MSADPGYLERFGIKAVGGPHDGRYLSDSGSPWLTVTWYDTDDPPRNPVGVYRLRSRTDDPFRFDYVWHDRDWMERDSRDRDEWQRAQNRTLAARVPGFRPTNA